ncbi:unnamed protein product [Caenorhabditis brenneri]
MEQDPRFQKWLRPEERPVLLTHDFYKAFLRKNPGYNPKFETPSDSSSPNLCSNSENEVQPKPTATPKSKVTSKLVVGKMESNKQLIQEAALQKTAGIKKKCKKDKKNKKGSTKF